MHIWVHRVIASARERSLHFHFFKNLVVSGGRRKKKIHNKIQHANKQIIKSIYCTLWMVWFGWVGLQASWTQHESHICEHCDRALCFNLFVHTNTHTHTDKHNEYLSCELLLMSGLSRAHSILINKCVFFFLYKTLGKCRLQLKRKTLHAVWCGYFNIKSGFGLWILVSLVMLRCNVWCCRIVPSITL